MMYIDVLNKDVLRCIMDRMNLMCCERLVINSCAYSKNSCLFNYSEENKTRIITIICLLSRVILIENRNFFHRF